MRPQHAVLPGLTTDSSDADLARVIEYFAAAERPRRDIAALARMLAESGEVLSFGPEVPTSDVASTGGPASLSTLLAPLHLAAFGHHVPKVGVPGRPAGGVDVMAQIPGYDVSLSRSRVRDVLDRSGLCHLLAGAEFTPLDARLFAFRQQTGTQSVPALVVASLLAKKIAAGVARVGLDVRVSPFGNFGGSLTEARQNALLFCEVGAEAGVASHCFITEGTLPAQPYLGRGEALLALQLLFEGRASEWLTSHAYACARMAGAVAGRSDIPIPGKLRQIFLDNVVAQGGDVDALARRGDRVAAEHNDYVRAPVDGFVGYDLNALRQLLVDAQHRHRTATTPFPDPAGVVLLVRPNSFVARETPVVSVRAPQQEREALLEAVRSAVRVDPAPHFPVLFDHIFNA